ncbi:FbpB family small basic protein [Bacillus massiliglaciei]|nr:FbpB family small basic protein [Bacillus massiliglaciei]
MKKRKKTFEELVRENKNEVMKDSILMERIEKRLEQRHIEKAE